MAEVGRTSTGSRENLISPRNNFQIYQIYGNGVMAQPKTPQQKRESKYFVKTSVCQSLSNNRVVKALKDYCIEGTLHGLQYIGSTSLSIGERFFWLLSFSIAVGASGWFILNVYEKWQSNPVIMSYGPYDSKLSEFPFPAITICSLNRAKKNIVEKIANESDTRGKLILEQVLTDTCELGGDVERDQLRFAWNDTAPIVKQVHVTCDDIIKQCRWSEEIVDCKLLFTLTLADDGMCCFFNRLPSEMIYRKEYNQWFVTDDSIVVQKDDEVYDWTPQRGYLNDKNADKIIPRRANGPGLKSGLTLILDATLDHFYCSSTGSAGFKMLLSSPSETPRMTDYAHLLRPGEEVRISITPVITEATESLRNVPIFKRRCYFQGEKFLKYYRHYSKTNCHLECESNRTFAQCQCAPYYLPKSPHEKFCVHEVAKCLREVRKVLADHDGCQCLDSCYDISYTTTKSSGKLLPNSIRKKIDIPDNTSAESITVVHFFFMKSSYNKLIKSELFAFTDIVSNIGGLLGLFMGFSIMSIVEIIYFLSLRLWCSYHKERSIKNSKKTFNNQDHFHISIKS